jgi:saccharopine dehydrogenase (NAD+, L-lysine forming)
MVRIGIIKEYKTPSDIRVPFSPAQLAAMSRRMPGVQFFVESYPERCYSDEAYLRAGIQVVNDLSHCDYLFGVKEVPAERLIPGKTYFFFSHTIKRQPYNKELLRVLRDKKIRMIDYELLRTAGGDRIAGFGRFAGIVGAYMGLQAFGNRTKAFGLPNPTELSGLAEAYTLISQIHEFDCKVVLSGGGRVANGALECLARAGFKRVPFERLERTTGKVVTQVDFNEYYAPRAGGKFSFENYVNAPDTYESKLAGFLKSADMFIAGHYWDSRAPYLISREELRALQPQLQVVADISCDIAGPVACTVQPSTLTNPVYGYSPVNNTLTDAFDTDSITVMAVDNLPCALPIDASYSFGNELEQIINLLSLSPVHPLLAEATICEDGEISPRYPHLAAWLDEA